MSITQEAGAFLGYGDGPYTEEQYRAIGECLAGSLLTKESELELARRIMRKCIAENPDPLAHLPANYRPRIRLIGPSHLYGPKPDEPKCDEPVSVEVPK